MFHDFYKMPEETSEYCISDIINERDQLHFKI